MDLIKKNHYLILFLINIQFFQSSLNHIIDSATNNSIFFNAIDNIKNSTHRIKCNVNFIGCICIIVAQFFLYIFLIKNINHFKYLRIVYRDIESINWLILLWSLKNIANFKVKVLQHCIAEKIQDINYILKYINSDNNDDFAEYLVKEDKYIINYLFNYCEYPKNGIANQMKMYLKTKNFTQDQINQTLYDINNKLLNNLERLNNQSINKKDKKQFIYIILSSEKNQQHISYFVNIINKEIALNKSGINKKLYNIFNPDLIQKLSACSFYVVFIIQFTFKIILILLDYKCIPCLFIDIPFFAKLQLPVLINPMHIHYNSFLIIFIYKFLFRDKSELIEDILNAIYEEIKNIRFPDKYMRNYNL